QLRRVWDGRIGAYRSKRRRYSTANQNGGGASAKIVACMISCPERDRLRARTLRNLAATDWGDLPVTVEIGTGASEDRRERQQQLALRALQHFLAGNADYLLFLEDDLKFNRHLRHNLLNWRPLMNRDVTLAGLYNPNLPTLACDVENNAVV